MGNVTELTFTRCRTRFIRGVLLCLFFGLAGCDQPPRADVSLGLSAGPVTLDPRFATDAVATRLNRLLYARLVDFDEALAPTPALAKWVRLGQLHYRFHLDEDRDTFHDGATLTAADVVATYESILDKATGSPHRGSLTNVASISAASEDSVDFHLHKPDPLFPGKLVVGILPAELIRSSHPFNERPVGSGPFEFQSWSGENRVRMTRRRDGAVVDVLKIQEPTTRVLKLLRGEVDLIQSDVAPEVVGWLSAKPGVKVSRAQGTRFSYVGFNLEDPVVGKFEVRQAIAHALDRDAIVQHVFKAGARPASALLVPTHWAGHSGLVPIKHDLAEAKRLLAKAGYGEGLEIVYKTSADPFRIRIASIIQAQLKAAGITVKVQSHDWGTFFGDVKAGRFQMYSLAWVGIKMPDIFRYVFHSDSVPPKGANRGRYRDERTDELIEQAESTSDLDAQAAHYRALQARLLETLPYVPLWYEDNFYAAQDHVRGYRLTADGNYDGLLTISTSR
ncbi:MAG: ABC transporter substrate-binding protein [Gammaproteobacteria bacterium]|nr:ABC transporter substrate-binding protein [Gammaproteobacteria bacterium]